mmetsp:Transcript_18776/g.54260  ORF Transcript_18776/g.54260 Transcript_18776/m.54260 type:complete len:451 (+) Transcript_18776:899-2251(+)
MMRRGFVHHGTHGEGAARGGIDGSARAGRRGQNRVGKLEVQSVASSADGVLGGLDDRHRRGRRRRWRRRGGGGGGGIVRRRLLALAVVVLLVLVVLPLPLLLIVRVLDDDALHGVRVGGGGVPRTRGRVAARRRPGLRRMLLLRMMGGGRGAVVVVVAQEGVHGVGAVPDDSDHAIRSLLMLLLLRGDGGGGGGFLLPASSPASSSSCSVVPHPAPGRAVVPRVRDRRLLLLLTVRQHGRRLLRGISAVPSHGLIPRLLPLLHGAPRTQRRRPVVVVVGGGVVASVDDAACACACTRTSSRYPLPPGHDGRGRVADIPPILRGESRALSHGRLEEVADGVGAGGGHPCRGGLNLEFNDGKTTRSPGRPESLSLSLPLYLSFVNETTSMILFSEKGKYGRLLPAAVCFEERAPDLDDSSRRLPLSGGCDGLRRASACCAAIIDQAAARSVR